MQTRWNDKVEEDTQTVTLTGGMGVEVLSVLMENL